MGEEDVRTAYLLYSNQITLQRASRAAIKRTVDDRALPKSAAGLLIANVG